MSYSSNVERFVVPTADGLELVAECHGNPTGAEVLLVHGLGQSRLSWSRQTQGTLTETCHIVSYDLRGHGDSSKPPGTTAYDDPALWASDLHAVIEASGLRRPMVVGWSLGALVVGHYVHRYGVERTRIDEVVLGSFTRADESEFWAALQRFVNTAHEDAVGGPFEIEASMPDGDAASLIHRLVDAIDYDDLIREDAGVLTARAGKRRYGDA